MNSQASYILAFDTSTPRGRCAALRRAAGGAEEALLPEEIRISRTLLPQVEELLRSKSIDKRMIQAIGVSVGPGTFTGLRVGLSCAKGLALGLGRPLYGFSSLEAMATGALLGELETGRKLPDYILPCRDAGRGELFTALFRVSKSPESPDESVLLRVRADEVIEREALRLPEDGDALVASRREDLPEFAGSGASGAAAARHEIDSSAAAVARLTHRALESRTPPPGANLTLNYFRKPQAQTKWADPGG